MTIIRNSNWKALTAVAQQRLIPTWPDWIGPADGNEPQTFFTRYNDRDYGLSVANDQACSSFQMYALTRCPNG